MKPDSRWRDPKTWQAAIALLVMVAVAVLSVGSLFGKVNDHEKRITAGEQRDSVLVATVDQTNDKLDSLRRDFKPALKVLKVLADTLHLNVVWPD